MTVACNALQEPLEELYQWAHNDTLEFYQRGEKWVNWTDEEADAFNDWKLERLRGGGPLPPFPMFSSSSSPTHPPTHLFPIPLSSLPPLPYLLSPWSSPDKGPPRF